MQDTGRTIKIVFSNSYSFINVTVSNKQSELFIIVTKNCDTFAVRGNKYLHCIGLAKWPLAKLNNTVHSVYICAAVCIVCCTTF